MFNDQIELALDQAIDTCGTMQTPPKLASAMRHAVFSGGNRLRSNLCLSVIAACSGREAINNHTEAAISIELLHCASLVHDDLPCFDNALIRRGKPSVHVLYGEPLAILTGNGLMALAFSVIAKAKLEPSHQNQITYILAQSIGAAGGLVAGQAWESERNVDIKTYHQAKTAVLFSAAAKIGALLSGESADRIMQWENFGTECGEAYQAADDIIDIVCDHPIDKPIGQDLIHNRPNIGISLGIDCAYQEFVRLLDDAYANIPECLYPQEIREWIRYFEGRLPQSIKTLNER